MIHYIYVGSHHSYVNWMRNEDLDPHEVIHIGSIGHLQRLLGVRIPSGVMVEWHWRGSQHEQETIRTHLQSRGIQVNPYESIIRHHKKSFVHEAARSLPAKVLAASDWAAFEEAVERLLLSVTKDLYRDWNGSLASLEADSPDKAALRDTQARLKALTEGMHEALSPVVATFREFIALYDRYEDRDVQDQGVIWPEFEDIVLNTENVIERLTPYLPKEA